MGGITHDSTLPPLVRIVEVDGTVFEMAATTPKGNIRVITEMTREGDTLILGGMHIDGLGPWSLGRRLLEALVTDLGRQQAGGETSDDLRRNPHHRR